MANKMKTCAIPHIAFLSHFPLSWELRLQQPRQQLLGGVPKLETNPQRDILEEKRYLRDGSFQIKRQSSNGRQQEASHPGWRTSVGGQSRQGVPFNR